jgi:rare lipoprotein A (peptidoglycan hydrolase)
VAPDPKEAELATEQTNPAAGEPREPPGLQQPKPATTAAMQAPRRIGSGRATWYQHPGRTASGEIFNPNRLTAAHHTLPFGTRVRVVHEPTGRSVEVRINDRIPRRTKAVIDLSRASARVIGLSGVARVSLYQL